VATAETVGFSYLQKMLVMNRWPIMFVGASGAGKTCLVREGLHTLESESHSVVEVCPSLERERDSDRGGVTEQ